MPHGRAPWLAAYGPAVRGPFVQQRWRAVYRKPPATFCSQSAAVLWSGRNCVRRYSYVEARRVSEGPSKLEARSVNEGRPSLTLRASIRSITSILAAGVRTNPSPNRNSQCDGCHEREETQQPPE